jgi:hypothetical protein
MGANDRLDAPAIFIPRKVSTSIDRWLGCVPTPSPDGMAKRKIPPCRELILCGPTANKIFQNPFEVHLYIYVANQN